MECAKGDCEYVAEGCIDYETAGKSYFCQKHFKEVRKTATHEATWLCWIPGCDELAVGTVKSTRFRESAFNTTEFGEYAYPYCEEHLHHMACAHDGSKTWWNKKETVPVRKICNCPTNVLMISGCQCGRME